MKAKLLEVFLSIVLQWEIVFPQERTFKRAVRQSLGTLVCLGRRTLTRIIWTNGGQNQDWSSEYLLYSRCIWNPQELFTPVVKQSLPYCKGRYVGIAVDDTRLHKTGRCIEQAFYQRDPLSPPFHVNLMLGLRFMQASLLVPLHRWSEVGTRALPIRFEEVSCVKKPGRKATEEQWQQYRADVKQYNLSKRFVTMTQDLRHTLDTSGAKNKIMVIAADGSYCNRTVFASSIERTEIVARTRKDAVLCHAAQSGSKRFYATEKFTPEQVRKNDHIPWKTVKVFYGGQLRTIRYKEVSGIYWQGGARRRPLRLLVVAPQPYLKRKSSRLYYRRPAFLLTTALSTPAHTLLQIYFDRWQIEVNHREEKDTLGVGQAQLWNVNSVPKQPVLAVASYSALLLASLLAFGAERTADYNPLPIWRKDAKRPSCLDLIALLRKEMCEHPEITAFLELKPSSDLFTAAAAA
jgi:hypothetical protein